MASIPFLPTIPRHRQPLTGSQRIIVYTAVGFFIFLIWAMLAKVDEVTAGQGTVIPSSKVQLIQATEPATVSELLVRSGQQVKKGQLLARLDNPQSRQIQAETQALEARSERLAAEGLGSGGQALRGEEATLSAVRRQALSSRIAALNASADQRRREMAEAQATVSSLSSSLRLAQERVRMLEPLASKNIVPQTELLDARREVIDLQGRIAGAREQAGRAAAAIREAQSQASEANFQFRQEALNERSQVEQKIAVNEQSLGGRGPLGRLELRSPVDGIVNDVKVTTIGGFVNSGEKVMEVVPLGEKLLVETRVKPSDIAFIKVGDRALVKITAYDFSTYGGLEGKVVQVSADSIYDEVEKQAYFTVIVETEKSYLQSGTHRLPITPG
ncbi:MAG TPA: HlyD family type I secretion periplasmic adaptor subunit, partial [Sphingomicrobium sp.]|nr:HlyD family type I secretion periplasmic adaptor subunit [Sphingomicrobium sp.]